MHILIITQYYPPEPHPIPHDLAKGMIQRGHNVTVVTGFPNHPQGKIYRGYKQQIYKREKLDNVNILRLPVYPNHSLSTIKRMISYLSFATIATILTPILTKQVDIIFVYHTPTAGIPAWWLSILRKIPFVFNVQDLYPETFTIVNLSKNNFLYKAADRFTQFIYKKASMITVISDGFKNNLIIKGIPQKKIETILSWADENIYFPETRDEKIAKRFGLDGRFNIIFAGNMGPAQGLSTIIEAAALIANTKKIQFVFVGDGATKNELIAAVNAKNLSNVIFLPRQPATIMPKFYALADALLVILTDNPLFETTIPYKTYTYLACGKPIIMSVKGNAADLITKSGAGILTQTSHPVSLVKAIKALYTMSPQIRNTIGGNGRKYYVNNLSMKIALNKYEELFKIVINNYKNSKL